MKKKWVKRATRLLVVLIVLAIGFRFVLPRVFRKNAQAEVAYTTELAAKRDISNVLTSSGSIQPLNQYNITTLVKGEIIKADFEEGDTVEEGQVLYQIATDEVDSTIKSAKTTLSRAQDSYDKSVRNYNKALEKVDEAEETLAEAQDDYQDAEAEYQKVLAKYNDLTEKSAYSGTITGVMVSEGDTIQKGAKIADIYDDSVMVLTIPFNASEVSSKLVGKEAKIEISGMFETLKGTVTEVDDQTSVNTGNQMVKNVKIEVKNPGGIISGTTAIASVASPDTLEEISCNSQGTFAPSVETAITSGKGGEIKSLMIRSGQKIGSGDVLFVLDGDSVENQIANESNAYESAKKTWENAQSQLESAKDSAEDAADSVEDAEEAIEDAQTALDESVDDLADCEITSPVTGIVITKDMLVGDVIGTSNFSSALALIYDVSAVTFEMSIDELDIGSVKVGQTVKVTADAIDGVEFTGTVVNVSLASTTSGGVTQYPVTVRIDETGDLLPGMNVTGEIVIEGVENVLTVPVDALQRGDMVYVKDDTVKEAQGMVPAGFRAVNVTTGLSDGDYIQIIDGLSEGDEVYVTRTASGMTGMDWMMGGSVQMDFPSGGTMGGGSGGDRGGRGGSSGNSGGSMTVVPAGGMGR